MTSAVADVVNQTAAPFQNLKKPADVFEAFSQAQAVVGAVAGLANAPTEFLNNAFARATNGIAKALPSFDAATIGSLAMGIPHTADLTTEAGGHSWSYFEAMAAPMLQFVVKSLEADSRRLL